MMDKIETLTWAAARVLKEAREQAGLTQGQLAGFSGLSDSYIALVEQGNSGVSINALMQIADVLKLKASDLMIRIEQEMERGPQAPTKGPGRPRKQDKTSK